MRREPDGTVTASVYVDLNPGDRRNGIWTFNAPCGAGVLWWVFEKPYQVLTLVFLEPPYGPGCGRPGGYQPLPQGPRRRAPRVRSASRAAKALGAGQRLPRKFSRR
ncbi:hypothetical protein SAMN05421505_12017 [Sinosporangium album]|uniref:Uncharacterized protein n=2 Tax=Sinosporangium album TaxID=504805 RepID=A0A1G8EAZ2_9ACTN|nr:hypothetical protein SAMN05421505_12017 [Sinosporangium album]